MRTITTVKDIVDYQLCTGCGLCSYIVDEEIMLENSEGEYRPNYKDISAKDQSLIVKTCPGINLNRADIEGQLTKLSEKKWGKIIQVFESSATDTLIRFKGGSGGVVSALAQFALASGHYSGVLQVKSDKAYPLKNISNYSTTFDEIIESAGSRYAPASPLSSLSAVIRASKPSVIVGKPCDIAAVNNMEKFDAALRDKTPLKIAIFCAGVPSGRGNKEYLKDVTGRESESLSSLKYRGEGWPGTWKAEFADGNVFERTYAESWSKLTKSRQWRCLICPDHSGEFADISVGDPWYREVQNGETGSSMVIVRTRKGLNFVNKAVENGIISREQIKEELIDDAQKNLLFNNTQLFGRLLALSIAFLPKPNYAGFKLYNNWNELSFKLKVMSVISTLKRIYTKKIYKRNINV